MRTRLGFSAMLLALALGAACGGGTSTGPSGLLPVVAAINGATLPSGPAGSTVIIEGQNFGASQGSGQVLFSNGSGGTVAAVIASAGDWTASFILTAVPNGAATGNLTVLTSAGTSAPIVFTITQNAAFSPSIISWTGTRSLPTGLSGLAAAYGELKTASTIRAVYALGGSGAGGTTVSTAYVAIVGNTGTLGPWTATAALPTGAAFSAAAVTTPANSRITAPGFVYFLGGASNAAGQPVSTVYRGSLAADGRVSAWAADTPLPAPLHSLRAALFHGDLYLAGGSTTGNVPVATVYRSRIGADGTLGAWQVLASLPFKRSYFGFGQLGGYLYAFGGDSGGVAPNSGSSTPTSFNDVVYARIDLKTGNLTAGGWLLNAGSLKKAVSKHTAVIAGGNVLITGGLYNGAGNGATEESYAQLSPDGSVGSLNGATGSNTIQGLGGGNLFNHAAVGYVDGTGVFHVLVLGGDDVNLPGTKHAGVYFY